MEPPPQTGRTTARDRLRLVTATDGGWTTTDRSALIGRSPSATSRSFARLYDELAPIVYGVVRRVVRDPAQSRGGPPGGHGGGVADRPTIRCEPRLGRLVGHDDRPPPGCRPGPQRAVLPRPARTTRRRRAHHHAGRRRTGGRRHRRSGPSRASRRRADGELTPLQRQSVELAFWGGHTHAEVATLARHPTRDREDTDTRRPHPPSRQPRSHAMNDDPHLWSGLYAVDALEGDELARFEAHLATCPECPGGGRRLPRDHRGDGIVRGGRSLVGDPRRRPRRGGADASGATCDRRGRRHRTPRRRWVAVVAVAAAVVVIAGSRGPARARRCRRTLARTTRSPPSSHATTRRPSSCPVRTTTSVKLVWSPSANEAVLLSNDLAPPPDGKTYELWAVAGDTAAPASGVPPRRRRHAPRPLPGRHATGSTRSA